MTIQRTGIAEGFTEKEALDNWLLHDPDLNNEGLNYGKEAIDFTEPVITQILRHPVVSKRVHVNSFPRQGIRKFVTVYQVIDTLTGLPVMFLPDTKNINQGCCSFNKQLDAVTAAKNLSKETHRTYKVVVTKILANINDSPVVAEVIPSKAIPGQYKFTAVFKY